MATNNIMIIIMLAIKCSCIYDGNKLIKWLSLSIISAFTVQTEIFHACKK